MTEKEIENKVILLAKAEFKYNGEPRPLEIGIARFSAFMKGMLAVIEHPEHFGLKKIDNGANQVY